MPDRDDVIAEIVEHIEATLAADSEYVNIPLDLLQYALALLKEQEPVKPIERNGFYYCGSCRYALMTNHQKYCLDCGKKVEWK